MPLVVELRTRGGRIVRGIPDPSGGTFDAAGDFDQLLDDDSYPTIRQVDPFGVSTLGSAALPSLLADITAALQKARPGVETRGLLRLRRLAELSRATANYDSSSSAIEPDSGIARMVSPR